MPLLTVIVSVSVTFLIAGLSKKWQDTSRILVYIPVPLVLVLLCFVQISIPCGVGAAAAISELPIHTS